MPRALAAALFLLLFGTAARAERDARVAAAVGKYESAKFADARDALLALLDGADLPAADRADARTYLAAAYLALGEPAGARMQLRALAREAPEARPSPAIFPPELVRMAADEREALARSPSPPPRAPPPPPPPPPAVAPAPIQLLPPPPPASAGESSGPARAWAFVPLGAGQFARGDRGRGALFLGGELALFGTAAVSVGRLESLKLADQPHTLFASGWYDSAHVGEARTLNVVSTVALLAGVALASGGVLEAALSDRGGAR